MSFTDFLELSLNLSDSIVLQVFDLLEGRADHAQGLRVNARGGQDLVDLGILGLKGLLNGFELTLKNQVAESGLLVELVDELVECVEQLHLFFLQVLVLLKFNFVFPLVLLVLRFKILNFHLAFAELLLDALMLRVLLA
jgi:hypothetical protein